MRQKSFLPQLFFIVKGCGGRPVFKSAIIVNNMFYWWAIALGNNGEIEVMIMETEQMIIYLTRLETVLDDLGKLLFKAHLKVPLTLDREQSQELLRQNNRFEFRYQQLRNQKTKLLKQLLKLTSGDIYLRQKIGQLNELNQQSQASIGCGTRVQSAAQN
ncbi:hypothetical protein QY895_09685 [Latilactobacillus sakei]